MEGMLYVVLPDGGRANAELVREKERNRILRLEDGRYATIVRGGRRAGLWTIRNLYAWIFLKERDHPGLLRVGDRVVDSFGDEGYLCEGHNVFELRAHDHPARRTLRDFLHCAVRLAEAAGEVHKENFVHGDITPGNVCFDAQGLPVLIDFEMMVPSGGYLCFDVEGMGRTFRIFATPSCCSPEHVLVEPVTPMSDVYCLGLTLCSWISGRFGVKGAYRGQCSRDSYGMCERAEYPHWEVVENRIDDWRLVSVLRRALELVPQDRYHDGHDLAAAFRRVLECLPASALERPLAKKD